ncbi:hypothetical protein TNCV_2411431 [Trichonephila clavipes]|nr:hypothetical protein TNCV_2411431 [Trichonephila clavipes]
MAVNSRRASSKQLAGRWSTATGALISASSKRRHLLHRGLSTRICIKEEGKRVIRFLFAEIIRPMQAQFISKQDLRTDRALQRESGRSGSPSTSTTESRRRHRG